MNGTLNQRILTKQTEEELIVSLKKYLILMNI
jgi:hypothetical protein